MPRYRDRHQVSEAKSDPAAAKLLADLARTAGTTIVASPATARSEAIRVLARAHQSLIWARTRHTTDCGRRCASSTPRRWRRSRIWLTVRRWPSWAVPRTPPTLGV
jgi:hypothetical protein